MVQKERYKKLYFSRRIIKNDRLMFLKRKIRKEIIDLNIYKSQIEIQLSD